MPPIPENLVLKGSKVILRPSEEKDYPALQKILSDLKTMQALRYMSYERSDGWPIEKIRERCESRRDGQKKQQAVDFIIHDIKTHEVLGGCGTPHLDLVNKNAEFGIILHHPYWGSGIAIECALLVGEYLFEKLGLHRVEFGTLATNARVRTLCDKFNIQMEGIKKDSFFEGGQFMDSSTYVIFEKDWPRVKQKLMDWNVSPSPRQSSFAKASADR